MNQQTLAISLLKEFWENSLLPFLLWFVENPAFLGYLVALVLVFLRVPIARKIRKEIAIEKLKTILNLKRGLLESDDPNLAKEYNIYEQGLTDIRNAVFELRSLMRKKEWTRLHSAWRLYQSEGKKSFEPGLERVVAHIEGKPSHSDRLMAHLIQIENSLK